MLRLPPFRLLTPSSIDEAVAILAHEGPQARPVAGGTDLWPNMKRGLQKTGVVASLMDIDELAAVERRPGELEIGATATLSDIVDHPEVRVTYPMLARAVASISSPPLRNMATLGGNLLIDTRCTYYNQSEEWRRSIDYCLKETGTVCWVAPGSSKCWAHTASDSAPMLAALDARVVLRSTAGERALPILELYRDDGIDYLGKHAGEILTRVLIPSGSDQARCRTAFWKLRRRGSIDFAVLSAAVAIWMAPDGVVSRARIILGAVASCPLLVAGAADSLIGRPLDRETIRIAAREARKAATPMDNTDLQAQWRGVMVERYTEAALSEAAGLPVTTFPPPHPALLA
jgi:4-hydroxybenzoyl-CoA reductase subunit beta